MRIQQQYEELASSLIETLGSEQGREKKENGEFSGKNMSNGKHEGRENKEESSERKMSVYAKMSDVKKALTM
ncbi:unnamed protein product, partial [Dovyalis caffra]